MLVLAYEETAQRITCPHRDEAAPSSAVTVAITNDAGTVLLAATGATKSSLSTTLAVAALPGARQITVASATGAAVGAPAVLTDAYGRTEPVVIDGVDGTTILLRAPLKRSYAIGDAFVGSLIYYDADLSDTSSFPKGNYYQAIFDCADWTAGPRGVLFRILDLATSNPITVPHITRWAPNAFELADADDGADLGDVRAAAWSIITTRMRSVGRDPDVWRDADDAGEIGGLLAAGILYFQHGHLEQSDRLIGNPPGEGGLWSTLWADFAKAAGWFDEDQDRKLDHRERRRPISQTLGRGL